MVNPWPQCGHECSKPLAVGGIWLQTSNLVCWASVSMPEVRARYDLTHIIKSREMNKGAEAFHALQRVPGRLRGRRRGWLGLLSGRAVGTGVGLVGDNALSLVVLDDVAGLVAKALGFCERVYEWFGFDGEETLLQTLVEEGVAGVADDDVGHLVQRLRGEVLDEIVLRLGDHLGTEVPHRALGDGWRRMVDGRVELGLG